MNRKLNRRGAPLHHLIIPPTDAVSPISSADKLDSTFMINCLSRGVAPSPSPGSSGKAGRRSPLESLRYGGKVVDDEVLVMDGVLVASAGSGSGSSSSSASGGGSGPRKGELCRSWEDLGHCRHGSKCQFAHGKEEIRPSCLPVKKKHEASTHKSYTSGSPLHGLNCRLPLVLMAEGAGYGTDFQKSTSRSPVSSVYSPTIPVKSGSSSKKTRSIDKYDSSGGNPASNISNQTMSSRIADAGSADHRKLDANSTRVVCWSPFDDDIEVTLPDQLGIFASREDVDAHINGALYGPSTRKRLPVFINTYSE